MLYFLFFIKNWDFLLKEYEEDRPRREAFFDNQEKKRLAAIAKNIPVIICKTKQISAIEPKFHQ